MKDYKTIQEVRDCEELSAIEKVQIEYYEDLYYLSDALANYADVEVFEGSAIEYATQYFTETYNISDEIIGYIDFDAFCSDFIARNDIKQFDDQYLITNSNYI